MRSSTLAQWFRVLFLAAVGLASVSLGSRVATAAEQPDRTPTPDPRFAMITELRAAGPSASLGDHADFLGQLLVGWVMDGHAIEDFWIVNPSDSSRNREVYADDGCGKDAHRHID